MAQDPRQKPNKLLVCIHLVFRIMCVSFAQPAALVALRVQLLNSRGLDTKNHLVSGVLEPS